MARKPFRAVPLKAVRYPPRRVRSTDLSATAVMLLLALAIMAMNVWRLADPWRESTSRDALEFSMPGEADRESASFPLCTGPARVTCVVDGDTFWYLGDKIRVADINTPEVSQPACPREARLGAQATGRMLTLLNQGPFTLELNGRDRDHHGRLLRTVTRGGESLGAVLVREGLAEEWQGRRGSWC